LCPPPGSETPKKPRRNRVNATHAKPLGKIKEKKGEM